MLNAAALLKQKELCTGDQGQRVVARLFGNCIQMLSAPKGYLSCNTEAEQHKGILHAIDCKVPHKITGPSRLRTPGTEDGKSLLCCLEVEIVFDSFFFFNVLHCVTETKENNPFVFSVSW